MNLQQPDEMLRDLLMEEVASACGTMPDPGDVESFLKERLSEGLPEGPSVLATDVNRRARKSPESGSGRKAGVKIAGFILEDRRVETGAANRTLGEILKEFHRRDSGFMERFADKTASPKRRLVARNPRDLYPYSPHLQDQHARNLGNGWWLGTCLNAATIRSRIKTACEVAGVKFGSDLKLIES